MCFFVNTIGRRKLFLTSTTGMLLAFTVWTVCSSRYAMDSSSAAAKAVIGMIFICYFFYNLAWSGLLIETLPYKIRAKGLTVMFLRVDLVRKFPLPTLPPQST
jgi:hypothetical protein